MTEAATAWIALGSNLGDREATLRAAVEAVHGLDGVRVDAVSAVYETDPVGPSTEPFLNAALRARVDASPAAILAALHGIERAHGRTRRVRWDARTLDLDLLLVRAVDGAWIRSEDARCRLPHPALLERDFVLAPLCDLDPDAVIAGRPLTAHLQALPASSRTLRAVRDDLSLEVDPPALRG
ncbi:MAG: 2-amino-4-hydroxy-6-hydroxymethyldihydropteridine diphosphokinase [Myxococcota bacterium]